MAPAITRTSRANTMLVRAVNYDPENLFKGTAPRTGTIERRMMVKQMETDKAFAAAVTAAQDEDRKKVLLRRQTRVPPTDHIELIEFFLNTQADDMEVSVRSVRWDCCHDLASSSSSSDVCFSLPVSGTALLLVASCIALKATPKEALKQPPP